MRGTIQIPKRHHGVSLVEILVTVVIISVGLLGVAALHTVSLRNNFESHLRSQATILAQDILDRMRANYQEAVDQAGTLYEISLAATPTSDGTSPLVDQDLDAWKTRLAAELPNGNGSIECTLVTGGSCNVAATAGKIFKITIQWTERTDAGSATSTYETEVEI